MPYFRVATFYPKEMLDVGSHRWPECPPASNQSHRFHLSSLDPIHSILVFCSEFKKRQKAVKIAAAKAEKKVHVLLSSPSLPFALPFHRRIRPSWHHFVSLHYSWCIAIYLSTLVYVSCSPLSSNLSLSSSSLLPLWSMPRLPRPHAKPLKVVKVRPRRRRRAMRSSTQVSTTRPVLLT